MVMIYQDVSKSFQLKALWKNHTACHSDSFNFSSQQDICNQENLRQKCQKQMNCGNKLYFLKAFLHFGFDSQTLTIHSSQGSKGR